LDALRSALCQPPAERYAVGSALRCQWHRFILAPAPSTDVDGRGGGGMMADSACVAAKGVG
jgi:hypothetical protein